MCCVGWWSSTALRCCRRTRAAVISTGLTDATRQENRDEDYRASQTTLSWALAQCKHRDGPDDRYLLLSATQDRDRLHVNVWLFWRSVDREAMFFSLD